MTADDRAEECVTFPHFLEAAGDALDVMAACLAWEDLRHALLSCSVVSASRLRVKWLRSSRVTLPPSDVVLANLAERLHPIKGIAIAHTACIDSPTDSASAWLSSVESLVVEPSRYQLPNQWVCGPVDLTVIPRVCVSLQELTLAGLREVIGITPLGKLGSLLRLDLSSTGVRDLSPLANLDQLQYLNLARTSVESFKPLRGLSGLKEVVIDGDTQWSLSELAHIPNLSMLSIRDLRVGDNIQQELVPYATQLEKFSCQGPQLYRLMRGSTPLFWNSLWGSMSHIEQLEISKTVIFDRLEAIAGLTKLRVLTLSTIRDKDLSPFASLQSLEYLSLTVEKCVDLFPLSALSKLRYLYCHGGDPDAMELEIGHVQCQRVIELPQIQTIDVSNHYLGRLTQLGQLRDLTVYVWSGDSLELAQGEARGLRSLSVSGDVNLRDIHSRFPQLHILDLRQSDQFDARDLPLFAELQSLTVTDTTVADVVPHRPMPQLRRLQLSGSISSCLSRLVHTPNICILILERTDVEEIRWLTSLMHLRVLNLTETRVRDVTPLLAVKSLETVLLPKRALCAPLVAAFHDRNQSTSLREVLHPSKNCVWGSHHRVSNRGRQPTTTQRLTKSSVAATNC